VRYINVGDVSKTGRLGEGEREKDEFDF